MLILGINGAPKLSRTTPRLLTEALDAANTSARLLGHPRITTDVIDLASLGMPHHDGSLTRTPKSLEETLEKVRLADGIIFATPVNWFGASSRMKTFVDWLTPLEEKGALAGKVGAVIAVCDDDGGNQAAMSLIGPLLHMRMLFPPDSLFYHNRSMAEQSDGRWQMTHHLILGRNVARAIVMTKRSRIGWASP